MARSPPPAADRSALVEVGDGDAREGDAGVQCAARERVAPPEHVQQQTLEREPEVGGELRGMWTQSHKFERHRNTENIQWTRGRLQTEA